MLPPAPRQDPLWRELLKHCAARGAYRGAGMELIQRRMRYAGGGDVDDSDDGNAQLLLQLPDADDLFSDVNTNASVAGGSGAPHQQQLGRRAAEDDPAELAAVVERIAEMALLGAGDAAAMYPDTLNEHYAHVMSEETEFRVAL